MLIRVSLVEFSQSYLLWLSQVRMLYAPAECSTVDFSVEQMKIKRRRKRQHLHYKINMERVKYQFRVQQETQRHSNRVS